MLKRYPSLLRIAAIAAVLLPGATYAQQTAPTIRTNSVDGTPSLISFTQPVKADAVTTLMKRYLPVSSGDSLALTKTTKPGDGLTYQRYAEYHNGIPVAHGSYVAVLKDGDVSYMSGRFYKAPTASATPAFNEGEALMAALDHVGAQIYMWQINGEEKKIKMQQHDQTATYFPKGELVWVEDFHGENRRNGVLHLAWRFNVYAASPLSRSLIYVDAQTKEILLSDAQIKHIAGTGVSLYSGIVPIEVTQTGLATYSLMDSTRGNGVYTFSLNNNTDITADSIQVTNTTTSWLTANAAIDAHWGAEKVYDYWDSLHNRLSYNDSDGALYSYVHYDMNYDNAFWDGDAMNYGDGSGIAAGGETPLVALDVCGHEIGHGVCQETCNLIYEGESGAMNEGFSDIWGASIENHADPHEVDAQAKNTWLIGEELAAAPFRDMQHPNLYDQPDTYLGTDWFAISGNCNQGNDDCGVHYNSGVLNHWFYLLSQGGTGTNDLNHAYAVIGLGIVEAGKIVYATELSLSGTSQYADCRDASIAAATAIYGACSPQTESVTRAWYAVGVGADFVICTPHIGFVGTQMSVSEDAGVTACPASKIITVPVHLTLGNIAFTSGIATATVTAVGGTAASGADYTVTPATFSFSATDTTDKTASLTIFDNGAVNTDRTIKLAVIVTANGTNASAYPGYDTVTVTIVNDDKLPELGGNISVNVNDSNATSNLTSPFVGSAKNARTQYIIPAAALALAGIHPGQPINSLAFHVTTKASTHPYTGYTVAMANTMQSTFINAYVTGTFTTVYSGNYTTAVGWDTLQFSNNFVWDGVSNVAMNICFSNTVASTGNDRVAGHTGTDKVTTYATSNATSGCSLTINTNNENTAEPVFHFTQNIAATAVEGTAASHYQWDVHSGQQTTVFYSSADSELIAEVTNPSADLGCTDAMVSVAGSGLVPSALSGVNRSVKEFSITPTQNGGAATYNVTVYFKNTEIDTTTAASMFLLKTDAATDADISASNTEVVTPTVVIGEAYTSFSGNFTGFSRYFLVDHNPNLSVGTANAASFMHVVNNPFTTSITLSYQVQRNMTAGIRLYDVAGKLLYSSEQLLQPQGNKLTIDLSGSTLAAGNYLLQVVTPDAMLTQKLLKL